MDTNAYLGRVYPSPPCWALVEDVYQREMAAAVPPAPVGGKSVRTVATALRIALHRGFGGFKRIPVPRDFCVVLMSRRMNSAPLHCGIYYGGRVLHAREAGTVFQDLASLGDAWPHLEYWAQESTQERAS
jgi:hypothetical protein